MRASFQHLTFLTQAYYCQEVFSAKGGLSAASGRRCVALRAATTKQPS